MSAWQQDGYGANGDSYAYYNGGQAQQVENVEASRSVTDSPRRSVRSGRSNVRQIALGSRQSHARPAHTRTGGERKSRVVVGTHASSASCRFLGPHLW